MPEPTQYEKAMLVATLAAGIMASHEAWRAFEHEGDGMTFEEWAIDRAVDNAKAVFDRVK